METNSCIRSNCRAQDEQLLKDFLQEEHKPFLNSFMQGDHQKYPGFDAAKASEDEWALPLIESVGLVHQPRHLEVEFVGGKEGWWSESAWAFCCRGRV